MKKVMMVLALVAGLGMAAAHAQSSSGNNYANDRYSNATTNSTNATGTGTASNASY